MKYKILHTTTLFCAVWLTLASSNTHAKTANQAPVTSVAITLPQDADAYVPAPLKQKKILSKGQQTKLAENYLEHYFAPWKNPADLKSATFKQQKKDIYQSVKGQIAHYKQSSTWGENLLQHKTSWSEKLEKQIDLTAYPNQAQYAIVIKNTLLRDLPTDKPAFNNPSHAGEGYPFDQLQNSNLWVGMPVYVLHQTLDNDWVLVIAPYTHGWIPVENIAYVNKRFMKKWQSDHYIVPTKDGVSVLDNAGAYRFKTHIGMLFPKRNMKNKRYQIVIPIADQNRQAQLIKATLATDKADKFPLTADYETMANEVNQLLNQPYGWGGLYRHRDCSHMLRDYFSLFGIWLPRSSSLQLGIGEKISLAALSVNEKDKLIIEKGIPYLTLVGKKGHVMLYIGAHNNQPVFFHNKWGLKTYHPGEVYGRAIIGRSAITDLHIGEDMQNTESLANTAQVMAIVVNNH